MENELSEALAMPYLIRVAEINQNNCDGDSAPANLFGLVISALRQKHGLSLEDLAKSSNIDVESIIKLECGKAGFQETALMIPVLAKPLRANPKTLIGLLLHLATN